MAGTDGVTGRRRNPGSGGNKKGRRASFGSVRQLRSGRWQARYTGPDGRTHPAPVTFDTKGDAEAWLALRRSEILRNTWAPPSTPEQRRPVTLAEYAAAWLADRQLKPRSRALYAQLLEQRIVPDLGQLEVPAIAADVVRTWYARQGSGAPTARAHAYALLRTILASAVDDGLLPANPCRIRGAGATRRVRRIEPATRGELEAIADAMPARWRAMVLLAAWCGLRFGELAELRRRDVDTRRGVVRIRRAVTRVPGAATTVVSTPKSEAGIRDVAIPPHVLQDVKDHLREHTGRAADALLFPAASGGHLAPSALYKAFYRAREAAGRPDLRFHDLRHTGAVLAAQAGATLAELMARLGHSTPAAALIYQHAAAGRDAELARRLSELAAIDVEDDDEGTVSLVENGPDPV